LIWYRIKFKMKSWTASSWQADTIFGHLCWGLRYLFGIPELERFLNGYDRGDPPLLLSNGFAGDFLPAPLLPSPSVDPALPLDEQKNEYEKLKTHKNIHFLSLSDFNRVINGQEPLLEEIPEVEVQRVTVKNQINRLTDTTGEEGSLYNFLEHFIPEVTIYLKVKEEFLSLVDTLFSYIADTGYGKRKSVGYGQIEDYTSEPFSGFEMPVKPSGFVSLSNFVPAPADPLRGYWRTITKYGRMGEEYALEDYAFKKPLMMLEAGSTFYDDVVRDYYGCLVKNLNPHYNEAVHYALALPVPISLPLLKN
jgi:CRISPR-associated protein Csm4